MRTIISTVGTSLLGNARRSLKLQFSDTVSDEQLDKYFAFETEPTKLSAEINALTRLKAGNNDRIVFLYSQTDVGEQCSSALERYFRGKVAQVRRAPIASLGYESERFKNYGLRKLVEVLLTEIDEETRAGHRVVLDATGGFKAQIAFAVLIGQVRQLPVYYIHELFNDIVEMPPVPVTWDFSVFSEARPFFDWLLEAERAPHDVESYLRRFSDPTREKLQLMIVEEGGQVALSATGYVFYDAFEKRRREIAVTGAALLLSARALKAWEKSAGSARAELWEILTDLRDSQIRNMRSEDKYNSDLRFYPTGHRSARIAFRSNPQRQNSVLIYDLFTQHDDYERALGDGRLYAKNFEEEEFEEWREEP